MQEPVPASRGTPERDWEQSIPPVPYASRSRNRPTVDASVGRDRRNSDEPAWHRDHKAGGRDHRTGGRAQLGSVWVGGG